MTAIGRFLSEYHNLANVLEAKDLLRLAGKTVIHAPEIVRSRKLTVLDRSMSHNLHVHYRGADIVIPVRDIDTNLVNDSPTFGTIREMIANDCYLRFLRPPAPGSVALDLGANRGVFSLLMLKACNARLAIGVEPLEKYGPVMQSLLEANGIHENRVVRINGFISGDEVGLSIDMIARRYQVERFGIVKIDIEGAEKSIFAFPEWLSRVDSLAMEVHPLMIGDLSMIPTALSRFGFSYLITDQFGHPCPINQASFVYASRIGTLIVPRAA